MVLDWLYVGGKQAASSQQGLEALGVAYVLSCSERVPFASNDTKNFLCHFRDAPGEELAPHFAGAFSFLDEAKTARRGKCLVHCMRGVSRSVAIVLAYLVARERHSLADAWALVRERRVAARPNHSFVRQLIALEGSVHGAASATLADFGHDE